MKKLPTYNEFLNESLSDRRDEFGERKSKIDQTKSREEKINHIMYMHKKHDIKVPYAYEKEEVEKMSNSNLDRLISSLDKKYNIKESVNEAKDQELIKKLVDLKDKIKTTSDIDAKKKLQDQYHNLEKELNEFSQTNSVSQSEIIPKGKDLYNKDDEENESIQEIEIEIVNEASSLDSKSISKLEVMPGGKDLYNDKIAKDYYKAKKDLEEDDKKDRSKENSNQRIISHDHNYMLIKRHIDAKNKYEKALRKHLELKNDENPHNMIPGDLKYIKNLK